MKRFFFIISLFFLLFPLVWKEFLAVALMSAARIQYGLRLSYRDVSLSRRQLQFHDLVAFDVAEKKSTVVFRAKKLIVEWPPSFTVEGGHISLTKQAVAAIDLTSSFSGSVDCLEGRLDWLDEAFPSSTFSFLKNKEGESFLLLQKDDSEIRISALEELDGVACKAELKNVPITYFSPWESEGEVSGSAKGTFSSDKMTQLSVDMEGKDLKLQWGSYTLSGSLAIDWQAEAIAYGMEWKEVIRVTEQGRFSLRDGAVENGYSAVRKLNWLATCQAGSGSKWEGTGFAETHAEVFPLSFETIVAVHPTRESWSDLLCTIGDFQARLQSESGAFSWEQMGPREVEFIQGFLLPLVPELKDWKWVSGSSRGRGNWTEPFPTFTDLALIGVEIRSLSKPLAFGWSEALYLDEGRISGGWVRSDSFEAAEWSGVWSPKTNRASLNGLIGGEKGSFELAQMNVQGLERRDPSFSFLVEKGRAHLFTGGDVVDVAFGCTVDQTGWDLFSLRGVCHFAVAGQPLAIPFDAPRIELKEEVTRFDLRCRREMWDFLRVSGEARGGEIFFDPASCHILGERVSFGGWNWNAKGISEASFETFVSLPLLCSLVEGLNGLPLDGRMEVRVDYKQEGDLSFHLCGIETAVKGSLLPVECFLENKRLTLVAGPFYSEGEVSLHEKTIRIKEGKGTIGAMGFEFVGSVNTDCEGTFSISHFQGEVAQMEFLLSSLGLSSTGWEGTFGGKGSLFISPKGVEADLEFIPKEVRFRGYQFENAHPVELFFSSSQGAVLTGLDFSLMKDALSLQGKVGLCQIDSARGRWIMQKTHLHLPADLLAQFSLPAAHFFDPGHEVDVVAEIESTFDFSEIRCQIKEGFLPVAGAIRHLSDLHLLYTPDRCVADCLLLHQGKTAKLSLDLEIEPELEGRLVLEDVEEKEEAPLAIDWSFGPEGLSILAIEGAFGGIEASFHAQEFDSASKLIGTARVHFTQVADWIPAVVGDVFRELKMGKGYELMGHLSIDRNRWSDIQFKGILSGKQIDLFGYQLRTLLAQAELSGSHVHLYDLKISDSAGLMKVDRLLLEGKEDKPWTIEIPKLIIEELRPSLLHGAGEEPGDLTPLLVRKLTMVDFKGLLDEGKTYTAKGELSFINSFRRGETILDFPSNVFGRIIGLDIDLLIPVVGDLTFHLKDGYFKLDELKGAFSEGKRSEFFLVASDDSPRMDLDGNLQILIKMKQFVLFKLTDAFMISIEGKLNAPEFRLQKKKRFLSLEL